jgi:hypothetical protein
LKVTGKELNKVINLEGKDSNLAKNIINEIEKYNNAQKEKGIKTISRRPNSKL